MMSLFNRLTEAQAKSAPAGRHAAGNGLWLCRAGDGTAVWQLSVAVLGEGRDLQIGTYPALSVRAARREAAKWRGLARSGLDPAVQQEAFRDAAARNLHQFYC